MNEVVQTVLDRSTEIVLLGFVGYQVWWFVDYLFITHKDTMNDQELVARYVKLVEKRKGKQNNESQVRR